MMLIRHWDIIELAISQDIKDESKLREKYGVSKMPEDIGIVFVFVRGREYSPSYLF